MLSKNAPISWLTQQSYDRLKAELDVLLDKRSDEALALGPEALEGRIRQLTSLLKNSRVHSPDDDGVVEPGMLVEVEIAGDTVRFLMGSREISDHGDIDVFSEKSPLGAAIYGKKPGERATYTAPSGRAIDVVVLSATPFMDAVA
ncbi:GreA/GreB family elongation factor [Arthrobacter castelli]|uniref:GreA/GreB family elongation factor n=1 Tax=Arthrobacter castelli TaxID=271431 RepID=UPI000426B888|nr:GreA/GreB family elongation factor [Arthrobacter castelli]